MNIIKIADAELVDVTPAQPGPPEVCEDVPFRVSLDVYFSGLQIDNQKEFVEIVRFATQDVLTDRYPSATIGVV
ncbi:hypothetical protein [Pseudomonas syringae group genomosp. 3]|uniref:hypothetical protein n=1 Tax=Pseudomonas syringae group genomosp. 3 TaxID=251701 RepID=UPI0011C3746E|nr:hypothetical protein [Pseudomonas syringae group genomosp. 3]